jgi:hypothetical protein
VNATFLQPFVSYTTPTAWSFTLNSETTYDWDREQWAVPVLAIVSKVTTIGGYMVAIGAGTRYWADAPAGGPRGWGFRVVIELLFPR